MDSGEAWCYTGAGNRLISEQYSFIRYPGRNSVLGIFWHIGESHEQAEKNNDIGENISDEM